ncbi:MAG: four helix bundle protein [Ignavibacteriaceae bacterium]|nr:four helix bundle protein [Ignavibacteriaceae bacterium]
MRVEDNNLYQKALAFAIRIVNLRKYLASKKREFTLSRQVLRSGSSIGANIAEANGGISKADFSNKLAIAYKEALETKFWLQLLHATEYIDKNMFDSLINDLDEIIKILFTILKKTRIVS